METSFEISKLGQNMMENKRKKQNVKNQEGNTLATIKDIEKGLEANLQECMNFLQVLTEENSKKGSAEEWMNEDMDGALDEEVVHSVRPNTAPTKLVSEHTLESKKPRFQNVITEVDLGLDSIPRALNKVSLPSHLKALSNNVVQFSSHIQTWSTRFDNNNATDLTPRPYSTFSSSGGQNERVCVYVRMRPFNEHEKVCPLKQVLCSQKDKIIVKDYNYLRHNNTPNTKAESQFDMDYILDDSFLSRGNKQRKEESQRCMYKMLGKSCVEHALDGCNSMIMAYGQMGSGKTYTMMGDGTLCGRGLVPRIIRELMHRIHEVKKSGACFSIQVSYLEIYQEKIRDLFIQKKMEQREEEFGANNFNHLESQSASGRETEFSSCKPMKKDVIQIQEHPITGPYVEGLVWKDVTTYGEIEKLMKKGTSNKTLATNLHKLSKRGHTLFTIKLIRMQKNDKSKGTSVSFINFMDLAENAGSEKMTFGQKPLVEKTYESKYINRSLAQLNDVFTNLNSGRSNGKFFSYRSSALMWLLQESLRRNTKTFLVANISPAEQDFQESVHTLKCAAKAKRIHGPFNQDSNTIKQTYMKMDDEIRTLQCLIADLTKNTTQFSSEMIKQMKNVPNEEDLITRPTRDLVDCRSCCENVFQRRPTSWR